MAVGTTALLGAAVGLGGSLLNANAQKKAAKTAANAAQFRPASTSNLFGGAQWQQGPNGQYTLNQSLSPFSQQLSGSLQDQALAGLNSPFNSMGTSIAQQGAGDVSGAYGAAQNYGGLDPAFIQQIMGQYQQSAGYNPQMVGGMPQVQSQDVQAQMLGNAPMVSAGQTDAFNTRGVNMQGLMRQAQNNPYAMQQMGMGQNLLKQDYSSVAAERLGLMRQDAAPQEQQQTDALMQRLFSQGRMGSTGGGMDITAFAKGLGQADVSRQLASQQFAQQLRSSDQSIGANLFSNGLGAQQQGQSLAANIGSNINQQGLARDQYNTSSGQFNNQLGLQAQLANQGVMSQFGLANQDAALRAGMSNQGANLSGQQSNLQAMLQAAMANQDAGLQGNAQSLAATQAMQNFGVDNNNTGYSRANDRVARASELFGFGTQMGQQGTQNTAQLLQLLSGITGQQNDLANLGIAAGGAQATAGANAGRFTMSAAGSPVGSFFQGLGGSMLGSDGAQDWLSGILGSAPKSQPSGWYQGRLPSEVGP